MKLRLLLYIFLLFSTLPLKAQKVGLVLSGGGARGLSHIGAIKALEENNIPIDYITGTSSGALVGTLYAIGYTPAQIEEIVLSSEFEDWSEGNIDEELTYYFKNSPPNASWITLKFTVDTTFQPNIAGNIIDSSPMEFALMENLAPFMAKANNNFDSLFVPFRCVAADIVSNQSVVFSNGDLAKALRASMAFPFYFRPVIDDNKILFDGGIYNNFPADVMMDEFYPDMIIGVNVSSALTVPDQDNIISQIKNMLQRPTNYSVICENGILIEPKVDQYGSFPFTNKKNIIDESYRATIEQMEQIKNFVYRRVDAETLSNRRDEFLKNLPPVLVDDIYINGVNSDQSDYVKSILRPVKKLYTIEELKDNYFKLLVDENIKSIYPVLKYNNTTGYFDLYVEVRREKDLITEFGGNFSSRPINQAYLGVQYNLWGKQSLALRANSYFGKLYSSVKIFPRLDVTGRLPYYIQPSFTLNRWDYFRSSTAFFEDVKPSYLIQSENYAELQIGIPARHKGVVWTGLSYVNLNDRYYQTRDFLQADTADK
ncbi:MAG: patatin-like phospholipase family protein, partial [Bacteroidia bacterium]